MALTKTNKTVTDVSNISVALGQDSVSGGILHIVTTGLDTKASVSHQHLEYAPLSSPVLTGTPHSPTPTIGNRSTRIATTQFVGDEINSALGTLLTLSTADGRYVKLAGSVMSGPLSLSSDPTLNMHAATKQYVDNTSQVPFTRIRIASSSEPRSINYGSDLTVSTFKYQNSTILPIFVNYSRVNSNLSQIYGEAMCYVSQDGLTNWILVVSARYGSSSYDNPVVGFVVPPGWFYRINSSQSNDSGLTYSTGSNSMFFVWTEYY